MAPRFKGLSQKEIEKLMNNFDDEYFADSDSDCEMENIEEIANDFVNEGKNDDPVEIHEKKDEFEWKSPKESDKAFIAPFTGNVGVKSNIVGLQSAYESFKGLFTNEILDLITIETNRYAEQVLELRPEESGKRKHSPEWTKTTAHEIESFLGTILLMGHIHKDKFQDYWSTDDLLETPIFRKIMPRDRFISILKFFHFENNHNKPSKDSQDYDRLWKIRKIFDMQNAAFKKAYDPSEELALDEVIVKFKGRVAFRQYIPTKRKQWGIKMYKISDKTGYTYDMRVYLGNDKNKIDKKFSASYNVVDIMTESVKGKGHKLYMDNYFSSPELFHHLITEKKINACGTVRCNRKNFPKDLQQEKLKSGDIRVKFGHGLTALRWKDKRDVYMLSSMHHPAEQTASKEIRKPKIVADYNMNMGYVDLSDRMANSYSVERRTMKWTKKLFFHLLDITVLNSFLLFKGEENHRDFRLSLIRSLIKIHEIPKVLSTPKSPGTSIRFDGSGHWPLNGKNRRRCVVCHKNGLQRRSTVICVKCNVALCIDKDCFGMYHTSSL